MFRHKEFRVLGAFCAAIFAGLIAFSWTIRVSAQSADLPPGPIQSKVQTACTECHDAGIILQQRLSKKAWTKEVDKMIKWGAVVDPKDRDVFIDYLSLNFPPEKPAEPMLRWVDAVMHFAAYAYVGESVVNPRKYFQNNVTGGLSVLHAVVDSNVRKFIFSSTCAVYGVPVKVPITEENPRLPVNPYGVSKLMLEQALEAYEHAYGFRFVCFRYFNAAGADEEGRAGEDHDPETHLIPSVFEAVHGNRSALEVYGDDYPTPDGTCVRDYIHVSDLAEAHVLGLNTLSKE